MAQRKTLGGVGAFGSAHNGCMTQIRKVSQLLIAALACAGVSIALAQSTPKVSAKPVVGAPVASACPAILQHEFPRLQDDAL